MAREYRTKAKDVITKYLVQFQEKTFCAKDICEYLKDNNISIDKATVYRNLEKLVAEGKVIRSKHPGDDNCYYQYLAGNRDCHSHLHLRCRNCGRLVHLEGEEMDRFYLYVKQKLGFDILNEESTLLGICGQCRTL